VFLVTFWLWVQLNLVNVKENGSSCVSQLKTDCLVGLWCECLGGLHRGWALVHSRWIAEYRQVTNCQQYLLT